jgi:hypothetical protein
MAKELPYFKFEPAEYLTKDISFCSIGSQGLFINICSYYWQRECSLTVEQVKRRFNYPNELQELIDEGIIDIENSVIKIKFLDLQYEDATKLSNKNSLNGSKGGRPKKNPTETQNKPKLNPTESQTKGIREDKRIKDNIIPTKDEFIAYALSIMPDVSLTDLGLKYQSWLVNDWCINRKGNLEKILNWKSTLTNTLKYLDKEPVKENGTPIYKAPWQ